MNGRKFIGASVAAISIMVGTAGTANADVVCRSDIVETQTATVQACLSVRDDPDTIDDLIFGRNAVQTCNSLESRLQGALDKFDAAKFQKAFEKLVQFESKVDDLDNLNSKGLSKIDLGTADALLVQVGEAIDCMCDNFTVQFEDRCP